MALYLISYDLIKQKDYTKLIDELKRLSAEKILLSAWKADLNNTPSEVFNYFKNFIDNDDRLVVIKFDKNDLKHRSLLGSSV